MSVNGKICWAKDNLRGYIGTQLCGGLFKEERFRVLGCYVQLFAAWELLVPLTVRVWTDLDGEADDESFGIDNVFISPFKDIKSEFNNPNDFEGWNCGKITACGNHQICGGYNVKGTGSEIKKTFLLPAGTYYVELDFIKIDSWCVHDM